MRWILLIGLLGLLLITSCQDKQWYEDEDYIDQQIHLQQIDYERELYKSRLQHELKREQEMIIFNDYYNLLPVGDDFCSYWHVGGYNCTHNNMTAIITGNSSMIFDGINATAMCGTNLQRNLTLINFEEWRLQNPDFPCEYEVII